MTAKVLIFDPPQNDALKLLSLCCLFIPLFLALVANVKGARWTLKNARFVLRFAKQRLWIKLLLSSAFLVPTLIGLVETTGGWELKISLFEGMTFGFFASYLFLKTLPPSVLVLSASGPHIKIHFAELKGAIFPVRPVALLRSRAESRKRGQMDVPKWTEWRISDDMFRQKTEGWLELVEQLAQLVPLIVFDVRVTNDPVLKEIQVLKQSSFLNKTIFVVDDVKKILPQEDTGLSHEDRPILVLPKEVTAIAKWRFRLRYRLSPRFRDRSLRALVDNVRETEELTEPDKLEIEDKYRLLDGLSNPKKANRVQTYISSLLPEERNQLLLHGLRHHPAAEVRAKCFSILIAQRLTKDVQRQVMDAWENERNVGAQTLRRIVQVEAWLNPALFIALALFAPIWNQGLSWIASTLIAAIGLFLTQRQTMRGFEIRYPPNFKRTFLHGLRLGIIRGMAVGILLTWHGFLNDIGLWNSLMVNSVIFGLGMPVIYAVCDRLVAGPMHLDEQKRKRHKIKAVLVWGGLAGVVSTAPYILLYIAAFETAASGYYFARDYAMDPSIQIFVVIWVCQVLGYATIVRAFEETMSVVRFLFLFAVTPTSFVLALVLLATGVISALPQMWHVIVGPCIGYGLSGMVVVAILGRKSAGFSFLLISPLLYLATSILENAVGITGFLAQLPQTLISYPFSSAANQRVLHSSAGQIAVNTLYSVVFCLFLFFLRPWWRRRRKQK